MTAFNKTTRALVFAALSAASVYAGATSAHAQSGSHYNFESADRSNTARIEFSYPGSGIPAARPAPVASAPTIVEDLAPRPVSTGSYFVQAASFTQRGNAIAQQANLTGSVIQPALVNGTQYFRVMVGPFQTRMEADLAQMTVAEIGYSDAFVKTARG